MSRGKGRYYDRRERYENCRAVKDCEKCATLYAYDETAPYVDDEYDPKYGNNPESCRIEKAMMLPSASLIPLATAFVRPQSYGNIYTPCDSLRHGTCFPELSIPYVYEEVECYE
jgi:hypothetical protein